MRLVLEVYNTSLCSLKLPHACSGLFIVCMSVCSTRRLQLENIIDVSSCLQGT
jgi:hypothetical protein